MNEIEVFEKFKKSVDTAMGNDLKVVIKSYQHGISKAKYTILKNLVETDPIKDVLYTVWMTGFCRGIRQARKVEQTKRAQRAPKVSRKFTKKWASKFWQLCCSLPEDPAIDDKEKCILGRIEQMFEEAKIKVEK